MSSLRLLTIILSVSTYSILCAQCTSWSSPTDSTAWTEFNISFGGAPCDAGNGCPFNELTSFEVFPDEAYALANVLAGGTYTFSACNNQGGLAWSMELTVIAPSGNVDAYGLNTGSICELTWTASENGSYIIVVSEAGACGSSTNTMINNGFPAITCQNGTAPCSTIGINEAEASQSISVFPNPSTGLYTIDAEVNNLEIVDIKGRKVEQINVQNTNGQLTFDLRGKAMGTYVVKAIANDVVIAKRISLIN